MLKLTFAGCNLDVSERLLKAMLRVIHDEEKEYE